ncbi:MAG: hypothetical protein IJV64_11860, partial [Oscillospiraceae bacterium]|nr:hypothetical protein [Oscillospiraceae bacterium]
LVGGLTGGLLAGTTEPVARATQKRAYNRENGQRILDNDWGEALGGIAEETAGIRDETTKALWEGTADLSKPKTLRQVGKLMQATMEKLDEKSRAYFENTMERTIAASMRRNGYEGDVASDAHILAVAYGEGRDALTVAEKERLETTEMRELYRAMTGNEDFTAEFAPGSTRNGKKAAEALAAVQGMLFQSRESVNQVEAEEAARAGSKLAEAARISADGKLHIKRIVDDADAQEVTGTATPELVGVTVTDGDIQVKVKTGDKTENVPFERVEFPDRDAAERVAISAAVGNEELANTLFNAKAPSSMVFKEFAKKFNEVYLAASAGINPELIRRSGIADGLQHVEASAAIEMGQKAQFTDRIKRLEREKALSLARGIYNGIVPDADIDMAAEATLKSIAGEELTEEEAAVVGKYDAVMEVVENATEENTQAYGGDTAYQYGLSGRSLDELAATIRDAGGEMTDTVRAEYERGAAKLAERETRRIAHINNLNCGADGTRKGVLRSISAEEAEANGVNTISRALTSKQRAAVTALRGFAESTGVNMVLFESTTEEGTHTGKEGWYDPKTQTVYLDVFAGYGNEQAILRTAAHELTHFIQSWSPAQYKRLRSFLLDYYYGEGQDTVKGLVQEQLEKNTTLSEAEAMDEVIADASEAMMGDGDAVKAMAEEHPRLFAKVKGWLDNWSKAITKAWRGITGAHSRAATMLQKSAEAFKNYQRMWYEALEDASVNLRGEVRTEQITELYGMDLAFPVSGEIVWESLRGDTCGPASFLPLRETLADGSLVRSEPSGGRSSKGDAFPYFDLTDGRE